MSVSELICSSPERKTQSVDRLFFHGMSVGSWMWEHGALPFYTKAGSRSWASALARHTDSHSMNGRSLEDFSSDLSGALNRIGRPCAVIGHSLAGAVVQRTVLLCSVPPYGLWRASLEMMWCNPELWKTLAIFSHFCLAHTDITVMQRNLFPNGVEKRLFSDLLLRAKNESFIAIQDMMGWRPLSQKYILVISGSKDAFLPVTDISLTAA